MFGYEVVRNRFVDSGEVLGQQLGGLGFASTRLATYQDNLKLRSFFCYLLRNKYLITFRLIYDMIKLGFKEPLTWFSPFFVTSLLYAAAPIANICGGNVPRIRPSYLETTSNP